MKVDKLISTYHRIRSYLLMEFRHELKIVVIVAVVLRKGEQIPVRIKTMSFDFRSIHFAFEFAGRELYSNWIETI